MVFTSTLFLYLFLPLTLGGYYLLREELRNAFLVLASLFFYAWGEPIYVSVMLVSIALNYLFGIRIASASGPSLRKLHLVAAVVVNLSLLGWFKYAPFLVENTDLLLRACGLPLIPLPRVHLPIGISFFTFHALSYVIDVYRGEVRVQRDPVKLALYITLFSQLVAGPIIRYHDVSEQLQKRDVDLRTFNEGIRRFILGMGKKLLLANSMGQMADQILAIPAHDLSASLAWLGTVCYTLQIYYDFSGYSDMAIGLGHMFGFDFLENFRHPYIARSIQEFWRRWHISLSNWFRDYLYIPLGGSRVAPLRVYFNLCVVFFLCGLWHGASWNFIIWGLLHSCFLMLERFGLNTLLERLWAPIAHAYVLLVVMVAWVFFREETLSQALAYLGAMFGLSRDTGLAQHVGLYINHERLLYLVLSMVFCMPVGDYLSSWTEQSSRRGQASPLFGAGSVFAPLKSLLLFAILFLCMTYLAVGTYNPFIYFRF
jgi:alginate O-acetyltransferase complex protein AlgI